MKIFKYAVLALGALVILAGGLIGYIAATFDPNQYKDRIVQAVKEHTGRTLRLDGDIGLSFWPSIGARIGKASLSERASEREFAAVEEVRVALKLMPLLSRQAIVDTVRVKGLRASLVKAKDGKLNVYDLAGAPDAKRKPAGKDDAPDFSVDIAGVEIVDAALTYADQATGSKYSASKVNLKTGRIAPGVPTDFEFSMHAQGDRPRVDLPVTLKARLTLVPEKQSLMLSDLVFEAKGTAAGLANLAVRLTGSADVDNARQTARAVLAGKIADSSVKAQLGITGFASPAIGFDVEMDQLDVDRYVPQQAAGGKPAGAGKAPRKEQPFDLAGLRDLRAAGMLKIGSLKASNVRASNVRMNLKASGGRVDIDPLSADFYRGRLAGAVAVNAAPAVPVFVLKNSMSGVNVEALLKDLAGNDKLSGTGDVTLNVTTRGDTVSALKRALDGSAAVKLADGAVKGIDVAGSIRNARAKLGALRGEHTQADDRNQKTDFSELTATFNIKDGIARNNDLSLKSPLLRVGGEGEINIGADTINYLVKASIVETSKGQGGRDADDLKGITVPVRVTGPLAAPSYKIDFSSMAKDAAKQAVKEALERHLGGGAKSEPGKDGAKSGGSTRDALRGILGR